jgi:hypothetical protein
MAFLRVTGSNATEVTVKNRDSGSVDVLLDSQPVLRLTATGYLRRLPVPAYMREAFKLKVNRNGKLALKRVRRTPASPADDGQSPAAPTDDGIIGGPLVVRRLLADLQRFVSHQAWLFASDDPLSGFPLDDDTMVVLLPKMAEWLREQAKQEGDLEVAQPAVLNAAAELLSLISFHR